MRNAHRTAATWLFVRFCPESNRAVLLGDLLEEFGTGRSSGWLWRQVLAAVMMTVATEIRQHGHRVIGGVAFGIGVLLALQYVATFVVLGASHVMPTEVLRISVLMGVRSFAAAAATGWILGRLDRQRAHLTVIVLVCCYCVVTIPWVYVVSTTVDEQWSLAVLTVQASAIISTVGGLLISGMWPRYEPLHSS